jgi:transcriptional regulator with XRE-family HTH domain
MSVEQLAGTLKVDPRTIAAWETGQQSPPFHRAEKLADKLRIPFGYLFLSKPPKDDFPLPDLRTVGNVEVSKPSLNFIEVVNDALLKQQWYSEYLEENGAKKVSFVGSYRMSDGVQRVAANVSKVLGIDDAARANSRSWQDFLTYIIQAAEGLGVLVMQRGIVGNNTKRRLDVKEFRGFVIADKFAPLVFINARDAKAAKNFTIVHTRFVGRPRRLPLALALRSPARTRSAMRFRSPSATAPKIVKTSLPVGVLVSTCSHSETN